MDIKSYLPIEITITADMCKVMVQEYGVSVKINGKNPAINTISPNL